MNNCSKNIFNPYDLCESPLGLRFNNLFKRYNQATDKLLKEEDIDRYFFILRLICEHKSITQQCLADSLQIDKTIMVRIIDYLSKGGFINRTPHATDRRAYLITPTEKALNLAPKIDKTFHYLNQSAFKGFTKQEINEFKIYIERMEQNLLAIQNKIKPKK
ncbi:MAG: MarR family transcriptional regulator [Bacteroidia bacterium]|nr:MarR family transcriptional regulator [Bacteroidia bacterium]